MKNSIKIPLYHRNSIRIKVYCYFRTDIYAKNTNENAMYRHSLKIVVVMIIKYFLGVFNIFKDTSQRFLRATMFNQKKSFQYKML